MKKNFCIRTGHENFESSHFCKLEGCQIFYRWCCTQCIAEGIHNHNKQDLSHILPWKQLIIQKKQEATKFQQNHQNKYQMKWNELQQLLSSQTNQLQRIIFEYQQFIKQMIEKIRIQKDREASQLFILDIIEENFMRLDNNRINEILNFNFNKLIEDQSKLFRPIQKINQHLGQIQRIIKVEKVKLEKVNNFIDLKKQQYQIKLIDKSCNSFMASQISNNESYLAYGGTNQILKIYNISKNKIVKEIKTNNIIQVCQFTLDSKYLFVGSQEGYVYGYDVIQDLIKYLKNKFIKVGSYLITCSYDSTIIKTDIQRNKQIFKLIGHDDWIKAIDYNMVDDQLLSGSDDKSLKLWDCYNRKIIINKEQSHPDYITQVQLINTNQNILSLDESYNLYKWKIDLTKMDFIQIFQISDLNKIYSFYQINQNQNLLLVCGQYIRILDNQGETINTVFFQTQEDFAMRECRQIDTASYIQIRSNQKIMLAILQN